MRRGPLTERYTEADLDVLTSDERARLLRGVPEGADWSLVGPVVAWELLYRLEPDLYERLIAGETIHPAVLDRIPGDVARCVEVAGGTGRLTQELVGRCREMVVVEPARPLRERLARRLGAEHVRVVDGWFDALPVPDGWADLVVSCSALTPAPEHGGDAGVAELERVAAPGGIVMLVWPSGVGWLRRHGYTYECFDGDMAVEFRSVEEAVELASVFYPDAVDEIRGRDSRRVPYELLGINAPRDVAWKRVP